jgi:hypothetical protein
MKGVKNCMMNEKVVRLKREMFLWLYAVSEDILYVSGLPYSNLTFAPA